MQKTTGLRTEIIVNISLLLGAALLFSGFLLLKFTEQELVTQRIKSVAGTMKIVSRALSLALRNGSDEELTARAEALLRASPQSWALEGWRLVDHDLESIATDITGENPSLESRQFLRMRYAVEPEVQVHYPLAWIPFVESPESYLVVTAPLRHGGNFVGAIQANFSLADLRFRMLTAYKLVFIYIVLYGTVLVFFGIYLLGRTVVRPVRRLQRGTQQVSAGDLDHFLPLEGPREIADLAESFNTMITALKASREEKEATIISLRNANADLKRTRDELVRSEKMASVGHLAAGMAHEIGNPLGAVVGYLDLLRSDLPSGREKEIVELSLAEALRIDRLVRDLLDYSSPASVQAEFLNPATVLREARDVLSNQGVLADLYMIEELPASLPPVFIARHKLLQVFVNLLLNARDASPEGGRICLSAAVEAGEVRLSVADEGGGIPAEQLNQIFNPFYTTKPPGKGRGLGLSVCHRIIEEAGGRIEVHSNEGRGSIFSVRLKAAEQISHEA